MALIEAAHLRKTFETLTAVEDVSLGIAAGEIYGLVGPDGAGKTTTLRLLVGALKSDSGEAAMAGFQVRTQAEQARAQVGYLSQRFSLYEDLSVLENIRFFAEVRGLSRQEWLPRCMEILDFVGLAGFKDRPAGKLSGGMKQKLGLASALVARPKILLLDEPTTGVDPVTRQDFWQLLVRIVERDGVAVLLTTPYMDEAARCHRVGFMRLGRIIAEGTPAELRSPLSDRIVEAAGGDASLLRRTAEAVPGVEEVRLFGSKLHLRVKSGSAGEVIAALRQALPASGPGIEARTVPAGLEDVFIYLSEEKVGLPNHLPGEAHG